MNSPSDRSGRPDGSDRSVPSPYRTLRPHGGYRRLRSFQVTQIIYDATVAFCDRFVDRRSRTHDQMVQAARSGRQNIAEGSRASATSSQTELKLVGVARASLDELLLDYEDFLRQRRLRQWAKDAPEALAVRRVAQPSSGPPDSSDSSDPAAAYSPWLRHPDPAVVANALICLIHQANYLLDQQLRALEQSFIQGGGYREQLHAARLETRSRQALSDPSVPSNSSDQPHVEPPACPKCAQPMVLRTARTGPQAGSHFWGCSAYPECKGTRPANP
ncbi:MAG: four helix bundle protein [Verrucomicrobia bacterium]|nr:four helix bundle protein [Verrucomicrobiota bacterium]